MRYDVFLSFSGEYIRKTFLSHLLRSLNRKGIRAATSAESYPMYNQAIEQCLVAISLISENYTSLDLWVDELAKIIKCAEDRTLTAVPVFLQVHPSDVLRVVSLAEEFADRNGPRIIILETVKHWLCDHLIRNSGFDSRHWEDDSKLVDKITSFVADTLMSSKISSPSPSLKWGTPKLPSSLGGLKDIGTKKKGFVHHSKLSGATELSKYKATQKKAFAHHSKPFEGMYSPTYCLKRPAEEVCELLCAYSTKEIGIIGIHGMEGVGKTILAKYIYEVISPQFQHHIFIDDLTKQEISSTPSLLEIFTTKTSFHGSNVIKELVGQRKILVVADSVDDIKQLQCILKEASLFGPGSRVIVITQDRSLLVQCGVKHIYEVMCPGYDEAIHIFSHFAFKQREPVSGFEGLTGRAVEVAGRIPLALKVLGSFLHGRNIGEWESTMCRLELSHDNFTSEIPRYVSADNFTSRRRPIIVEPPIDAYEANRFPSYCFTLN
ncbi:PREDICTED: disease resistance protein RML1A-like [Camelina sativa]|uniref:Disease resistance protein RML1A-like n=1 Tax=Camelina sativa TaxID=90675 RepID=A0ABM0TU73_CAMSA|nr:PREDICTED: disease resistance protein RML1A-like [Camelina sativa]